MATAKKSGDKPVKPKAPAAPKLAAEVKPKPAAKKPAVASKAVVEKAPAKATKVAQPSATKAAKASKAATPQRALAPDQRRYYIEVAAYYIAERRGFCGESQLDDWVAAEEEIDRLLREGILNP